MGADDAAAVNLNLSILANQPKLNRVPKQPAQPFQGVGVLYFRAHAAIVLKEVCKYRVRVHGDVPKDVMENVRLRNVSERIAAAKPGGRREHARGEHLKKSFRREKPAHRRGAPAGPGSYPVGDRGKIGQPVILQPDDFKSFEVFPASMRIQLPAAPADQFLPNSMLVSGIVLIFLSDEIGCCNYERSNCHDAPP